MSHIRKLLLLCAISVVITSSASAQAVDPSSVTVRKQQLQEELNKLEAEMGVQKQIIDQKQKEGASLSRDVSILNAKITKSTLSIKLRDAAIRNLASDISNKQEVIGKLTDKLGREKQSLAQLIRRANEIDAATLPEVVLSNKNLSEFFGDLDSFDAIKLNLRESLLVASTTRQATKEEKDALEDRRQEEEDLKRAQELERARINGDKLEKNRILKETKGQEAVYQKLLKTGEKDAARIRAELFTLSGSAAIPFEKALTLANRAGEKTGVRPAFILGIVAEESNLGQNVGKGNWQTDMHPTRDVPIFKQITAELGLDPDKMPVSKKVWYGWGGAMGPSQFIPSTWVGFKSRIAAATGHNPPNPWDPEDAIMATALYSKDNGADKKTYTAEFRAAMCYLAGCGNANKKSLQFYGEDVMDLASKYQKQIDILGGR